MKRRSFGFVLKRTAVNKGINKSSKQIRYAKYTTEKNSE